MAHCIGAGARIGLGLESTRDSGPFKEGIQPDKTSFRAYLSIVKQGLVIHTKRPKRWATNQSTVAEKAGDSRGPVSCMMHLHGIDSIYFPSYFKIIGQLILYTDILNSWGRLAMGLVSLGLFSGGLALILALQI